MKKVVEFVLTLDEYASIVANVGKSRDILTKLSESLLKDKLSKEEIVDVLYSVCERLNVVENDLTE